MQELPHATGMAGFARQLPVVVGSMHAVASLLLKSNEMVLPDCSRRLRWDEGEQAAGELGCSAGMQAGAREA